MARLTSKRTIRIEYQDEQKKWHTFYTEGTSTKRVIVRERRKLTEKYGVSPRNLSAEIF